MKLALPEFNKQKSVVPGGVRPVVNRLPANAVLPLPQEITGKLAALARRHLVLNLGEGGALWLRVCAALLLGQALADWWLNLPFGVRVIFLLLDIGILCWLAWRGLYQPWKKRIHLPGAALLAQKTFPELRGALIASVQLADARTSSTQGSLALVKSLIRQTGQMVRPLDFRKAAPARKFWRAVGLSAIPAVVALALAAWSWPASGVLLARIFLFPVPLPTKTTVVALTKDLSVPAGSDVELSARAAGVVPLQGRVTVTYSGGQVQDVPVGLRSDAADVFSLTLKNVQRGFRYQFVLNDGRGESFNVRPMDAPAITSLECKQTWPAYTGLAELIREPANLSLLAGSKLRVRVSATLPMKRAVLHLAGLNAGGEMKITSPDRRTAEGEIAIVPGLTGFSIALTSEENVQSIKDTVYRIDVLPDEAPGLTLLKPREESGSVTLSSKAPIALEVTEDYGLKSLALCYRIEAPPVPGAQSTAPSAEVRRREFSLKDFQPGSVFLLSDLWDFSAEQPRWQEGWKIIYWFEAMDNNTASELSVTRTSEREWIIVSPEAKRTELAERLRQDAQALKELSTRQEGASKEVGNILETQPAPKP